MKLTTIAGFLVAAGIIALSVPACARFPSGAGTNGNGDVFLTDITITEPTGTSQTEITNQGLMFLSGTIDSSHHIKCIDQDSSTEVLCQEDVRASDLTPSVRMESLTIAAPYTGSETKTVKAYVSPGAPATGTDCAISDVTSTAYDGRPLTFVKINGGGNVSVNALTALNSGNSGWVNSSTATVLSMWRHGGGL